ncbi:MAG: alkene reductase, partial [Pseudomonadota bacterium]
DGRPWEKAAEYYSQRASAGLIISEATQISAMGKGYLNTPGIYTDAQVEGWRAITDAVHAAGGQIFSQLWHVGRISHVSLLPEGRSPVSSSAIRAEAQTFTAAGFEDCSPPEALTEAGIAETLADYRHAASQAKAAGFDGVEVHAANGYLLDQFLQDHANKREDAYGGSIENRMRFVSQVIDTVAEVWERGRMGVRLSPLGQFNDMGDSDPEALFSAVYRMISEKDLAYLHVVEEFPGAESDAAQRGILARLRAQYSGFYIANGGFDASSAAKAVEHGHADAVTFGRPYIANPDLPERYQKAAVLNEPDHTTFYGGDERGYTDYPTLQEGATSAA